jgi:ubiquinone biosynthesis protein
MRAVVRTVRGATVVLQDSARALVIGRILIRYGFRPLVQQILPGTLLGAPEVQAAEELQTVQTLTRAQRIRLAIEELGPTFIKLGQILSTRTDIVPPDICAELQTLQDRVPSLDFADVRAIVEKELGAPLADRFARFDETPLATASIAQVHLAELPEGSVPEGFPREVVVKVQRPNLAGIVETDLHILLFLAAQAERAVEELRLMDPVGIVQEFSRALRRELDFENERGNMNRFRLHFADHPGLRIPRSWDAWCTQRVLTMERIRGVKVTLAPERYGIDPYDVAPRMLQILFKMVFEDGYFHGDLHPGNILISEDAEIGLIDFGLVGRLNEAQRDQILDILIGLSRQDYREVARVFYDVSIKLPGITYDYAAFEADVEEVMERHVGTRTLREIDVAALFGDLVAGAVRHQTKMPPTFTMVFKALMTVEGIGKTLAPEINFIEEAQPFVRRVLMERYSPQRILSEATEVAVALGRVARTMPHQVGHLLGDLTQGKVTLRHRQPDLAPLPAAVDRLSRRLSQAILGAALLVTGAMAAVGLPGMWSPLGMPWITWVFWSLGLWFTFWRMVGR